jgi:adenine/guanine phosphoribosyltransferase-like PRPP-binding protein
VRDRLGVRVVDIPGSPGPTVADLAGIALRRNPRRAHLLVSPVLAKHVPADPGRVLGAARDLAAAVAGVLGMPPDLVIGYAETATGLGHEVAVALGARYLHSTRREALPDEDPVTFEEEHSHASAHRLLPRDPAMLRGSGPLVLVDDELSTGRTALNTIRALHRAGGRARKHYVVAALLDLRSDTAETATRQCADELGVRIDVIGLARGSMELPDDLDVRGTALVALLSSPAAESAARPAPAVRQAVATWPADVPHHGRTGMEVADHDRFDVALARYAAAIDAELPPGPWHVLGTEELMYLPVRLAQALATLRPGERITCSSTTRSPIVVVDEPGYPIRSALRFVAHDSADDVPRYVYNLAGVSRVLLVVDASTSAARLHAPDGLLGQLAANGAEVVVARVPASDRPEPLRGPAFGSYDATDVAWLLTDLSEVALEKPAREREEWIQSGTGHYAESLPVEYVPSPEYQALYLEALERSRVRVAQCIGTVAEMVLAERGSGVVLASLARAGTPVGVLLRSWLADRHGLDVPHYAMSIVRGRGIDENALAWLAAHHDPHDVMFVDGWTGKGMITRELADAVAFFNSRAGRSFSPDLAVLADTGHCVELFGTRDDFLIPSACLNSTVSGLVSRTVLRPDLIGPGMFHGAKFYGQLAEADVSRPFLASVRGAFPEVIDEVSTAVEVLRRSDRTPSWSGREVVADLGARFGIADENLIKPGVGETTRVLLRRVPWKVLVRAGARDEVPHVIRLAEERGVEIVEVPDLGYTTVGLIEPRGAR